MRVALLTNIPAPYRVPVYDRLAQRWGDAFHVFYLARRESNRHWDLGELHHAHTYLPGYTVRRGTRHIHFNPSVVPQLHAFGPDVVLTSGFNPAMIAGWLYALGSRRRHIAVTDAWLGSEAHLSRAHRLARKAVISTSHAFIGASDKSLELFRHYGARDHLFKAPLCVDNQRFGGWIEARTDRPHDLVFAGSLIGPKLPLFFVEIARRLATHRTVSVLVIGDGELRGAMERALRDIPGVRATFTGFLQQSELPAAYVQGKVLCFPTENDAWGVVVNEAMASGLPVLTCANAGSANELVIDGETGYVLPLDAQVWADHVTRLLDDGALREQMTQNGLRTVASYTFDAATEAFVSAMRSCYSDAPLAMSLESAVPRGDDDARWRR